MSAQEIINKAMREAGFAAEFHGNTIVLNISPIDWRDIYDLHEGYHTGYQRIPGVLSDEGQGEGYSFEIDPEEFTVESERRLLRFVQRTQDREQNARQAPRIRQVR